MTAGERVAARLGSILSVAAALWGLAFVPFPFGTVGGAVAAVFSLLFGVLALVSHARGRWRKAALVGVGISSLALPIFGVLIVFLG